MSSATESFDVLTLDGRRARITIDRRELSSTMIFRLKKTRKGKPPTKVVALEGGVKAEWLP